MPNVTCRYCGNDVNIQGIGRICPHCGQLITLSESQPPEPVLPQAAADDDAQIDLLEEVTPLRVEPVEQAPRRLPQDEPTVDEPPAQEEAGPSRTLLYSVIGVLAAVFVISVATIIILLTSRTPTPPPTPVVIAPPPPPKVPAPQPPPPQPPPHAALASIKPRPPQATKVVTDEMIGQSIARGVAYLKAQFENGKLKRDSDVSAETNAGLNALAVYALLHAGLAVNDRRLGLEVDQMNDMINNLKELPMTGNRATYSRSLRISALTVYNRSIDRPAIEADLQWLLRASTRGAYSYDMPPLNRPRQNLPWDNSNSQYGALGVWAAAEAGYNVPTYYWNDVERHWLQSQLPSGGWGYNAGMTTPTLSMTVAGTAMLFVSRDRPILDSQGVVPYAPQPRGITKALEWLNEGNNSVQLVGHRGYTAFGLERAALASGFKYFGTHDWYRELSSTFVAEQAGDGAWGGADGPVAETSFMLLFLARGRHPTFLAKLKFDGAWNNRPRDVSSFSRFAVHELERPLNWQVADIQRNWWEYSDAPVLLITSNKAPDFTVGDLDKLRSYATAGGLILLNAERNSEEFNRFAADLAGRLFPNNAFAALPESHPIYSSMYVLDKKSPLNAVSNGARLLLVHSPTDLTGSWISRPGPTQRPGAELSMNILVYAAGRQDFRNRLVSLFVPEPTQPPVGTVPLARLKYEGAWDPEPMAWLRTSRLLQNETGVALRVLPTAIEDLRYESAPIAHLTGTAAVSLKDSELAAIREFVSKGGVLLVDSCGSSQAFSDSFTNTLLPALFPGADVQPFGATDPLLINTRDGMKDIRAMPLRTGTPPATAAMRSIRFGAGRVIFSPIDISSGLAGSRAVGLAGYQPDWCRDLVRNITFVTIARISDLVAGNARTTR